MTLEGTSTGVETAFLYLTAHIARGTELQALRGVVMTDLVGTLIRVAALTLWHVDDGKGTKRLDGNATGTLAELTADLVEHGGKNLLDGGLADTAALDDGGNKTTLIIAWLHNVLRKIKYMLLFMRYAKNDENHWLSYF